MVFMVRSVAVVCAIRDEMALFAKYLIGLLILGRGTTMLACQDYARFIAPSLTHDTVSGTALGAHFGHDRVGKGL